LNLLRLRWFTQEVDDAGVDRGKLQDGSEIEFTPDPHSLLGLDLWHSGWPRKKKRVSFLMRPIHNSAT
jgi:hypothetical protein